MCLLFVELMQIHASETSHMWNNLAEELGK